VRQSSSFLKRRCAVVIINAWGGVVEHSGRSARVVKHIVTGRMIAKVGWFRLVISERGHSGNLSQKGGG